MNVCISLIIRFSSFFRYYYFGCWEFFKRKQKTHNESSTNLQTLKRDIFLGCCHSVWLWFRNFMFGTSVHLLLMRSCRCRGEKTLTFNCVDIVQEKRKYLCHMCKSRSLMCIYIAHLQCVPSTVAIGMIIRRDAFFFHFSSLLFVWRNHKNSEYFLSQNNRRFILLWCAIKKRPTNHVRNNTGSGVWTHSFHLFDRFNSRLLGSKLHFGCLNSFDGLKIVEKSCQNNRINTKQIMSHQKRKKKNRNPAKIKAGKLKRIAMWVFFLCFVWSRLVRN